MVAAEHIARGPNAADGGRPCHTETTVRSLRSPQPEFDDFAIPGSHGQAGGLGGDKRLEVNDVEQDRFNKLDFAQTALNRQEWFSGENHLAFAGRSDIATKLKMSQKVEKFVTKQAQRREVVKFFAVKAQLTQVIERWLQAGENGIPSPKGHVPEKQFKSGGSVKHAFALIASQHCEFIQIGQ
jgi:hypothetical protein